MSNFIVPNIFIPGTKAKAQEVNENFSSIQDELNTKATKAGDEFQTFSVADATEDFHAVSKSQAETLIETTGESLKNQINSLTASFTIKKCYTNAEGEVDLLANSQGVLSFNVDDGTLYSPIVAIGANESNEFVVTELEQIDMTSYSDGVYNVFLSPTQAYALNNTFYAQKAEPSAKIINDVWLDFSVQPMKAKKYNGTVWQDFDDVPLGSVTLASGVITEVEQPKLNDNGYNINISNRGETVVETYQNGQSWYRLWSDGFLEQGGITSVKTFTFPKSFENVPMAQLTTNYAASNYNYHGFNMVTKTGFTVTSAGTTIYWFACGY